MKIGVFDSGVGGLSVAQAIEAALPQHEVILKEDREHVPYGLRKPEEILGFVEPIFEELVEADCDVIVVACNTVSTTLIQELRERFTIPLVAIEPMVKPAAEMTKSKIIAVCATPTTLASERYDWLKDNYAEGIEVLEPYCGDWPKMIDDGAENEEDIRNRINDVLDKGADVIVLSCTHFHWIEEDIVALAGSRAKVLQPEPAIIEQLKRVLVQLD